MIKLTNEEAAMVVEALRESARVIAGQSQAPYLFAAEETAQWAMANRIEQRIEQSLRQGAVR